MLIDARHPEETRVAVLKGNRIEEFDFESADHKQIKGNIYLAKVTRVEPSLQAAFVDFGGNRHGFLAFSEIHPDYYQIPKEDREALLAEEAAHAEEEAALRAAEDLEDEQSPSAAPLDDDDSDSSEGLVEELAGDDGVTEVDTSDKDHVATIEGGLVSNGFDNGDADPTDDSAEMTDEGAGESRPRRDRRKGRSQGRQADELRDKRMALRRRYKIQDVIHRRQVLLVQVVKEERGNKGAALTTYLSLAGRYCVLMPNSSHGGGISRKISSAADRKRLKAIIGELNLPKSMGCIVRTAGLSRTKTEIKRDFDYLARLWDEIRERTLKSSAPAVIHSDSDLIKRAIRDIYNRDIEEVIVEGEAGYRAAKEFMKLLMPSHARRVKQYADPVPLFQRYGAEDQLTAMYDPVVQLKSGGYLVINPTEALVSIDINSGRSTKEHGIEATALNTNLEAAGEIARQLRLRDMAGLVVIDFIDMEYGSNVRKVEKAMKDALKNDRARIQVGRISGFGLMEMSRQRLRTGVLEATTRSCPHCDGSGLVRTASSAGLSALRLIEDEAARGRGSVITLYASQEAAIYVLNAKRADLAEIEDRYGVRIEVMPEGENEGAKMRVGSSGPRPTTTPRFEPIVDDDDDEPIEPVDDELAEEEVEEAGDRDEREDRDERDDDEAADSGNRKRRKRRRGRRTQRDEVVSGDPAAEPDEDALAAPAGETNEADASQAEALTEEREGGAEGGQRRRRRRSRRRKGGAGEPGEEALPGAGPDENDASFAGPDGDDDGERESLAQTVGSEPEGDAHPGVEPDEDEPSFVGPESEGEGEAEGVASEPRVAAVAQQIAGEAEAEAERAGGDATLDESGDDRAQSDSGPAGHESGGGARDQAPVSSGTQESPLAASPQTEDGAAASVSESATGEGNHPAAPSRGEAAPDADQPPATAGELEPAESSSSEPPRRGWWQRTFAP
jgi:ribonuclease E